jgi:chromosome segregation ATPase
MGESSARNLRGDSMDDVIFSGSSSRSQVSKAFIELYFDNENNTLDAKFAKYSEIVIKREVSRDGVSNYYLNNTRCRRKDIKEVFLGTGLGPRSYAIIEQGMISRLVEAKPEELRGYLEEAAGISKYKEKRRETELRLKHTKDNLNRLNDVMKEITSQLGKLERQAKAAKDYKELRENEKNLKLSLLSLKWNNYNSEIETLDADISKNNIEHEKQKSLITGKDKLIEETRIKRGNEQDSFNAIQADFYHIGSEIARCEKDIEHSEQTESSRLKSIDEVIQSIENLKNKYSEEKDRSKTIDESIINKQKQLSAITDKLEKLNNEKVNANNALQNWQLQYNNFISEQLETKNKQEIEKTKISAAEKSIDLLSKRLKILESYTIPEDKSSEDKNDIMVSVSEVQQQISTLLVDIQRSDYLKSKTDKLFNLLPKNLKNLSESFKYLVKKIKLLVRSQQDEINDIKIKIEDYQKDVARGNEALVSLKDKILNNDKIKIKFDKERIEFKQIIDKVLWDTDECQSGQNDINVAISSLMSEKSAVQENISRLDVEIIQMNDRRLSLLSNENNVEKPSSDMQNLLKKLLKDKKSKESELGTLRNNLSTLDNLILTYESEKNDINNVISDIRELLEKNKISLSEKTAQRNSLKDNAEIPIMEIEEAIQKKTPDETLDALEKNIDRVQKRIDSLGAINLAAIDELRDQEERKLYLDNQYNDLSKSVQTLENAISKIDQETKSKFKEIFDQINNNLNNFFTKIFGGGKAYLELTDNDLLNTGVSIMARPPGKLVKNINLLSGGEKAGVGIAFVFSIFKINPAPFCLLDEVDAPLDDANNNRFCNVVKEMSQTVQFIFITHNKSTMELADVLSGVTMREAGVSKLVSVNVNEAVNLTSEKNINAETANTQN